ncbi:DNA-directed RNA polymerase III subunit RPC6, partial [Cichlidogyrus casuarinus]
LIKLFSSTKQSLTQKDFEEKLPDVSLADMLAVLNEMQKEGLLDVLIHSDRSLCWKLRSNSETQRMKSLTDLEEKAVYGAVNKAGSDGITLKSISIETKVAQNRLPKILKGLLAKKLIKELALSTGQKHKVYLLIDVEPSLKIATSSLFAGESGVDSEFVGVLESACLKYLHHKNTKSMKLDDPLARKAASYASLQDMTNFISESKISTVKMSCNDL